MNILEKVFLPLQCSAGDPYRGSGLVLSRFQEAGKIQIEEIPWEVTIVINLPAQYLTVCVPFQTRKQRKITGMSSDGRDIGWGF